ncbi:MAG: NAD(P)/FAD-dependent oxidoreductase [Chitinophagales bacterium]
MNTKYDVVIMGGGLSGLALAIQLKREKPNISILILEKSGDAAPTAAHKVGESTVELGSYYLRNVLGLKDYLEAHELPKHGLRFFFKSHTKEDITSRVELGPRKWLVVPSHQLDRGTLENHMAKLCQELGCTLIRGAIAKDVDFGEVNTVTYKIGEEMNTVTARWVVDATGRSAVIKRRLGFAEPSVHDSCSVWWRLKGVIDVDTWSEDRNWRDRLEPKLRYLSTVHFMDKGYWLWVIPLGSKNTSIGIVADPKIHPLNTYNTYEKAMEWLRVNEPLAYSKLEPETPNLMDFLQLKHYSHNTGRIYSADQRWGITGEAGAFLDPLYSPGTDFISMCNLWLGDLIVQDLEGEDISLRGKVYEQAYLTQVNNWLPIYIDKYQLMGNTQIMVIKIFWDWAVYWAVHCLLFTNKAFINISVLKRIFGAENGLGNRLGLLSRQMQQMFIDWREHETEIFERRYIDPYDLQFMRDFQIGLEKQHETTALLAKVEENLKRLEQIAAAIFQLVSAEVKDTPIDMPINPYTFSLKNDNNESSIEEGAVIPSKDIIDDVRLMWFYKAKELAQ